MHLERILAKTRQTVAERKQSVPLAGLVELAELHEPRGFARALRTRAFDGPAILAEIKKASPSRGLIRPSFDPAALARQLRSGGATALSVLTDEPFFQGSLSYLEEASLVSGLPCLRKDFIVDPYQLYEAAVNGADAVLLIVRALSDKRLRALYEEARELDLDCLVEVHDAAELDRALRLRSRLIGVNNRDLRDFSVDFARTYELVGRIPPGATVVAESGLTGPADLAAMAVHGVRAFLVGESLMRCPDIEAATRTLLAA